MIHTYTNHISKSDINRCSHSAFMVIEFSSSVVSPSFIHTVSFLVIPLFTFTDVLSSDDALRDMLESEMTTTYCIMTVPGVSQYCLFDLHIYETNCMAKMCSSKHCSQN